MGVLPQRGQAVAMCILFHKIRSRLAREGEREGLLRYQPCSSVGKLSRMLHTWRHAKSRPLSIRSHDENHLLQSLPDPICNDRVAHFEKLLNR